MSKLCKCVCSDAKDERNYRRKYLCCFECSINGKCENQCDNYKHRNERPEFYYKNCDGEI